MTSPTEHVGRTFSQDDQLAFAALSGDYNPLHVDPLAARRSMFGEQVVHGVHTLLWALDVVVSERRTPFAITEIRATFRRPIVLGKRVVAKVESSSDNRIVLSVDDGIRKSVSLEVCFQTRGASSFRVPTLPPSRTPVAMSFDEAERARGSLELSLDEALSERLFPALHACLHRVQLAELLASTRLVGMVCPGLCSIFSGLHLRSSEEHVAEPLLDWSVTNANETYSVLALAVRGPTLAGRLDAFYRPPAKPALSCAAIAARMVPRVHAERRALVVGGSRGLGEAIAKAVAVGGGEVCVTWNRGEAEARDVVSEITSFGGRASAMHLDVANARSFAPPFAPTHLYYLATPFIRIEKGAGFDHALFDALMSCYVHGLDDVVRAVHRSVGGGFFAFSPSTSLLSTRPAGSSAYCVAKAAMEELLAHLARDLKLTVSAPRLGRIETDQTSSLLHIPAADRVDVALEILRIG